MGSVHLTSADRAKLYRCIHLCDALERLHSIQHCGLAGCFSEQTRQSMLDLLHMLVQNIQTLKASLRELGLEAFEHVTSTMLSLDAKASSGPGGDDPHKFMEFAGLWSEMEVAYANVSVFIPPRVWGNEAKMEDLEDALCRQVAAAADLDVRLVDLISISGDAAEQKTGIHGKALLKLMGHTTGLEVTVVSGKYWPGADSMSQANLAVGIKLGQGRRKKGGKDSTAKVPRLALKMQQTQQFTTSRPGEINPVNPKFINEVFPLMIYAPNQMLVVTAYEQDKTTKSPIGEVMLRVDDLLSDCRQSPMLEFERSYGLVKGVSSKPVFFKNNQDMSKMRQSEIVLRFRNFTHTTRQATSKVAESVMKEACDSFSPLRAGCIVTAPAFHDEGGSWETIRIYVVSDYHEMQAERGFLERFVFPALTCKCQTLKLHFKWIDLSDYAKPGSRDDVVKRIHAIHQSRIRDYDERGQLSESHLVLCLLGEKRGRMLDDKDGRRVRAAEAVEGMYDWVQSGIDKGMSVLELELAAAIFHSPARCDPIICMRNPAFLDDGELVRTVPKHIRARFMETEQQNRDKMAETKRSLFALKPDCIIRYKVSPSTSLPSTWCLAL